MKRDLLSFHFCLQCYSFNVRGVPHFPSLLVHVPAVLCTTFTVKSLTLPVQHGGICCQNGSFWPVDVALGILTSGSSIWEVTPSLCRCFLFKQVRLVSSLFWDCFLGNPLVNSRKEWCTSGYPCLFNSVALTSGWLKRVVYRLIHSNSVPLCTVTRQNQVLQLLEESSSCPLLSTDCGGHYFFPSCTVMRVTVGEAAVCLLCILWFEFLIHVGLQNLDDWLICLSSTWLLEQSIFRLSIQEYL